MSPRRNHIDQQHPAPWEPASPMGTPAGAPGKPWGRALLLTAVAVSGVWIRVDGLTDPPFEFHPTRQYRSALIARDCYWRDHQAAPEWKRAVIRAAAEKEARLEPPVMEWLAAAAYRLGGRERLWIPRLASTLFWLVGAWMVYRLAARVADPDAALISFAFYLLLPYSVAPSRSFQPDPLMVMLTLVGLECVVRYFDRPSAIGLGVASLACGAAMFVKPLGAFSLIAVFVAAGTRREGWRSVLGLRRLGGFLAAALLPMGTFYVYGMFVTGTLAGQAQGTFLPHLLLESGFWFGWLDKVWRVVGYHALIGAALGGVMAARGTPRAILTGLWIGYLLMCLVFNYHASTHDYYHLLLIPTVAISVGPLVAAIRRAVQEATSARAAGCIVALAVLGGAALTRYPALRPPGGSELEAYVKMAAAIGEAVQHSPRTIFLSWAYGKPLEYHGEIAGLNWPQAMDLDAEQLRGQAALTAAQRLDGMRREHGSEFFIVTDLREFEQQKELQELLSKRFAVLARTPRYLIYDLRSERS